MANNTLFPKTQAALKELAITVERLNKARARLRASMAAEVVNPRFNPSFRGSSDSEKMPEDVAKIVNPDGMPEVAFKR
jgi:hypothetical protein